LFGSVLIVSSTDYTDYTDLEKQEAGAGGSSRRESWIRRESNIH
jgi:hypothetical protein